MSLLCSGAWWQRGLTQKVPPLGVEVGLVGQAAFEHIAAVIRAGPGAGDPQAVRAVDQLHDGPRALRAQGHLRSQGSLSPAPQGAPGWKALDRSQEASVLPHPQWDLRLAPALLGEPLSSQMIKQAHGSWDRSS